MKIIISEDQLDRYVRRRYQCFDEILTKLENGEEKIHVPARDLNFNNYLHVLTGYLRYKCDGGNKFDWDQHFKLSDIFYDRFLEYYKSQKNK